MIGRMEKGPGSADFPRLAIFSSQSSLRIIFILLIGLKLKPLQSFGVYEILAQNKNTQNIFEDIKNPAKVPYISETNDPHTIFLSNNQEDGGEGETVDQSKNFVISQNLQKFLVSAQNTSICLLKWGQQQEKGIGNSANRERKQVWRNLSANESGKVYFTKYVTYSCATNAICKQCLKEASGSFNLDQIELNKTTFPACSIDKTSNCFYKPQVRFESSPTIFCEGVQGTNSEENLNQHFIYLQWNLLIIAGSIKPNDKFDDKLYDLNSTSGDRRNNSVNNVSTVPIVFIVEMKKIDNFLKFIEQSDEWKIIGITENTLIKVPVDYNVGNYKFRITATSLVGVLGQIESQLITTQDGYKPPMPPKRIFVAETRVTDNSTDVLIGWEMPQVRSCFYKILMERHDGEGKIWSKRSYSEPPERSNRELYTNLNFNTKYTVRITYYDANRKHISSQSHFDFETPSCLKALNFSFTKCNPPSPRNVTVYVNHTTLAEFQHQILEENNKETQTITNKTVIITFSNSDDNFSNTSSGGNGDNNSVICWIRWSPPLYATLDNRILNYRINILELSKNILHLTGSNLFSGFGHIIVNNRDIPGFETSLILSGLPSNKEYSGTISSISVKGSSVPKAFTFSTKMRTKSIVLREKRILYGSWLYIPFSVFSILFTILLFVMIKLYLKKRKVKKARNQYFQSMEERDEISHWPILPMNGEEDSKVKLFDENFPKDKWEVVYEDLKMCEVIGQGAFGIVRKAFLPKSKFRNKDNQMADPSGLDEGNYRPVAVKMLKVSASSDDVDQLIKEILTMHGLGFHPQIVSLLGACTKGRTLCLVLEFCPGGNLLNFIRKVREKHWPNLNLSDSKQAANNSKRVSNLSNLKSNRLTSGSSTCSTSTSYNFSSSTTSSGGDKSIESYKIRYADIEIEGCRSIDDEESTNTGTTREKESSFIEFGESTNPIQYSSKTNTNTNTDNSTNSNIGGNGNKKSKCDENPQSQDLNETDEIDFERIDERDVLSFARQIAMGLEYLEKNHVVHRDIACRNVLLMSDYKQVKISDFGLSRDIYTWNVYHQKSEGKLPIKWMAIESIFTHIFTSKSDVWSFGILLWELVTLGGIPYPGLSNSELFDLLKSGHRMSMPENCSEEVYALMEKCWRSSPSSRPNFTELRTHLENMLENADPTMYLSLKADIPKNYFDLSSRSGNLKTDYRRISGFTDNDETSSCSANTLTNTNTNGLKSSNKMRNPSHSNQSTRIKSFSSSKSKSNSYSNSNSIQQQHLSNLNSPDSGFLQSIGPMNVDAFILKETCNNQESKSSQIKTDMNGICENDFKTESGIKGNCFENKLYGLKS